MNQRALSRWALLLAIAGALTFATAATGAEPLGPTPAPFSKITMKALAKLPLRKQEKYLDGAAKFYHAPVMAYLQWRKQNPPPSMSPGTAARVLASVDEQVPLDPALLDPAQMLIPHVRCEALGIVVTPNVCWHARAWRHAETKLGIVQKAIAAEAAATSCGATAAACAWYWDGATQCEVGHEGGFSSVSPDGTYAGRFQMDGSFETGTPLGKWWHDHVGRANLWPPGVQIEHAYTVWLSRGWSPWPPYFKYGCARYHGGSYPGGDVGVRYSGGGAL